MTLRPSVLLPAAAALAALLLVPAGAASAAPPAPRPTQLLLTTSASVVPTFTTITVSATAFVTSATAPAGTIEVELVGRHGYRLQLIKTHVTSAAPLTAKISAFPGRYDLDGTFTPDAGTGQTPVSTSIGVRWYVPANLSLTPSVLVKGHPGSIVATITTPVDFTPTFGGTVHLGVDSTAHVARCRPKQISYRIARCTLHLPALPAGTVPASAEWSGGNAGFLTTDFETTITVLRHLEP